jgi:hypothetical protein
MQNLLFFPLIFEGADYVVVKIGSEQIIYWSDETEHRFDGGEFSLSDGLHYIYKSFFFFKTKKKGKKKKKREDTLNNCCSG